MKFNQNSGTERYLKAATRGLWGRERRALQTELRGHISARVQEFRLGGLSEREAERQTLRELGAPVQVSGGMLGVHTLPALGKAGALSALLMTGLLTVLPQGLAQVGGKFLHPDGVQASSYLDFDQLRIEVKKVGGSLTGTIQNSVLSLPGGQGRAALETTGWPGAIFAQEGHQYIRANSLIIGLRNTGLDVSLSGWNPVQVRAGASVLAIQTGGDRRVSNALYANFAEGLATDLAVPLSVVEGNGNTSAWTFAGAVNNGDVYALIVPIFRPWWTEENGIRKTGGEIMLSIDSNAASSGNVLLRKYAADEPYKLYASVDALRVALKPYLTQPKINHWDAQHPAPALMVKLNGKFGKDAYRVVNPATVKGTITDH